MNTFFMIIVAVLTLCVIGLVAGGLMIEIPEFVEWLRKQRRK